MNNSERIADIRRELGDDLRILGHHYQNDQVVAHCDITGDSLELARRIPDLEASNIVFCGVWFMGETAAILKSDKQRVYMPDRSATCSMAQQALDITLLHVLERMHACGRRIVPLAYVNTNAGVKAVCGRFGGSVCTSANASKMLAWAMEQGDGVLFLPDRNLALNTADELGLPQETRAMLDIRGQGKGIEPDAYSGKELLVWPGSCVIHHRFKVDQIVQARQRVPDAKVIVHPECRPEVVKAADDAGSTSRIIEYVEQQPEGATIFVGTEVHLVRRLAHIWSGTKVVEPLAVSACPDMSKTTEHKLLDLLLVLQDAPEVKVDERIAKHARTALQRMLDVCA